MAEKKYIDTYTAELKSAPNGKRLTTLLWGDNVHIDQITTAETHGWIQATARGREGWIDTRVLSDKSLLELYIIDVGQGDAILVKTPKGSWILIDVGVSNRRQMTGKGAPNFIRWKFYDDLKLDSILLESVIITHHDFDHYGGLFDLLAKRLPNGKRFNIEIGTLYHSGVPRYKNKPRFGSSVQGNVNPFPAGDHGIPRRGTFFTSLMDGKDDFHSPDKPFEDQFSNYASLVRMLPASIKMLSSMIEYLPGYEPESSDLSIRVLGPIIEECSPGVLGLRRLGSESETINGHSITLRLDYDEVRLFLTGDLNERSQKLLMSYHPLSEFKSNVVKACHHGSSDFAPEFLEALNAQVTVVSSGDNENYAHPQPVLMGASGFYGRQVTLIDGSLAPPLIYSTELARSVKLAFPSKLTIRGIDPENNEWQYHPPNKARVKPEGSNGYFRRLDLTSVAADLIYGLVNIRTDGKTILCATMEERGDDFDVQVFQSVR